VFAHAAECVMFRTAFSISIDEAPEDLHTVDYQCESSLKKKFKNSSLLDFSILGEDYTE
jgi:hypothetical protein